MREALCATAPLGVLAFWGGLWGAATRYPSEYDWRYMTISSLLYPDRDPGGYLWAWGGVVLCGLGGLAWVVALALSTARDKKPRPVGIWTLGLGYLSMVSCALLPGRLLHFPKSHESLAILAFLGICMGTVQLTFLAAERRLRRRAPRAPGRPLLYACLLAGVPLLPILVVSATQAYIAHALPHLPWVGLEWRARGVPMYLSFAFWEWLTCAILSAYTSCLALGPGL